MGRKAGWVVYFGIVYWCVVSSGFGVGLDDFAIKKRFGLAASGNRCPKNLIFSTPAFGEEISDYLETACFVVTQHSVKSDMVLLELNTVISKTHTPASTPRHTSQGGGSTIQKPTPAPSVEKPTMERTKLTYEE